MEKNVLPIINIYIFIYVASLNCKIWKESLWVFTFWVPCCDVHYIRFPHNNDIWCVFTPQLFVSGSMSYLRYLYVFAYSGVKHIACCVFVLLSVSLDCPFLEMLIFPFSTFCRVDLFWRCTYCIFCFYFYMSLYVHICNPIQSYYLCMCMAVYVYLFSSTDMKVSR
jgi:hypothetical protein